MLQVFTFVFVICDACITCFTHAATEKPYRADQRDTVHNIWFRHVLGDLELKIFFVGQPWWPTCFMLHLPRNLGPQLLFHLIVLLNLAFNCSESCMSFSFDKLTAGTNNFTSVILNVAFSGLFIS